MKSRFKPIFLGGPSRIGKIASLTIREKSFVFAAYVVHDAAVTD